MRIRREQGWNVQKSDERDDVWKREFQSTSVLVVLQVVVTRVSRLHIESSSSWSKNHRIYVWYLAQSGEYICNLMSEPMQQAILMYMMKQFKT